MGPIYVLASLCVVGMIMIAAISMFSSGTGSTAIANERQQRRQAKLDQQESGDEHESGETTPPTPLPSAARRNLDDAA